MADLPSGAVTFLFTDIEGSTQLVKQLRERYGGILAEHQRLLREAFAAHGGHEIDTQGDAFFVAFASALEAVLAAVEGQRALSDYPWPDNAPVKVRIGIHTGQAVPVDGRYTGVAVHRAARICAAAHGGQVLVSQATQTLIEDEEEDLAVGLRDLGNQRLKDLDRPVRLYQIAAPGLAAEFPPLRREREGHAPAAAPPLPIYRRRSFVAAAAGLVIVVAAAVALLALRGGGSAGLSGVDVNHVGIIDPKSGHIVDQVQVGVRPGPVAVGSGTVWVGNLEDRTLSRIKAGTRELLPAVTLDNRTPTGIAVQRSAVWVAQGLLGTAVRVDPQFGTVSEQITLAGRSLEGVVTVGGRSVWVAFGESTFARIDPATSRVAGSTFAGANPAGIAYGADAVWVANSGDATVGRYNPETFEEGPVKSVTVGRRPSGIAYGEGALWVAITGDDQVTRIDPSSSSIGATIPVGDAPSSVAVGGGFVWVTNTGDGTVSRIDPTTNEAKTIDVGNAPSGIAFGDGYVWVAVEAP